MAHSQCKKLADMKKAYRGARQAEKKDMKTPILEIAILSWYLGTVGMKVYRQTSSSTPARVSMVRTSAGSKPSSCPFSS